jgi:hypothetical protein
MRLEELNKKSKKFGSRLTEKSVSTSKKITEDDVRSTTSTIPVATIIPAHLYDMLGTPYPVDEDGQIPEGFFRPTTVRVGYEDGMMTPEQAAEYGGWLDNGQISGELAANYDNHWYATDLARDIGASTMTLGADLARGAAQQLGPAIDKGTAGVKNLLAWAGLIEIDTEGYQDTTVDIVRPYASWLQDNADRLANSVDPEYLDDKNIMAGAVDSVSDLAGLWTGEKWSDLRFKGLVAMVATELPSELLAGVVGIGGATLGGAGGTAVAGPAGTVVGASAGAFAAVGELNALEAMGAAQYQMDQQIQSLYDDGKLQETDAWKNALMIASGNEEDAIKVIQQSTYGATVLRTFAGDLSTMQAVGLTAGTLDTLVDKIVIGPTTNLPGFNNAVGKMLFAATGEAADEGLQQLFINRGLINSGADSVTGETDGVVNAMWNGFLIGGALGAGSEVTRSSSRAIEANRAKLRQFLYGSDVKEPDALLDLLRDAPEPAALHQAVTDPVTGRLNLSGLLDPDVPSYDSLTTGQLMRLRVGGDVSVNGKSYNLDEIRRNDRAKQLFPILDNVAYNSKSNQFVANFDSEQSIRDAAALLGISTATDKKYKKLDAVVSELEKIINLDVRISGRTDLDPPKWSEMTGQQRAQFFNNGFVTSGYQSFTREQIARHSFENDDPIPDNALKLPLAVNARPEVTAAAGTRLNFIQEQNQARWDNAYGSTHNADGKPQMQDEWVTDIQTRYVDGRLYASAKDAEAARDKAERDAQDAASDRQLIAKAQPGGARPEGPAAGMPAADPNWQSVAKPGTNLARGVTVYNATLKIANGDLEPEVVSAMLDNLEKSYPGISEEIMPNGMGWYEDNYELFAKNTRAQPPAPPQVQPPAVGSTREGSDGHTYRFEGAQWRDLTTGRMATRQEAVNLNTIESEPVRFNPSPRQATTIRPTRPGQETSGPEAPGGARPTVGEPGSMPAAPAATPGGARPTVGEPGSMPAAPAATPGGARPTVGEPGSMPAAPAATPGGARPEGPAGSIPRATPGGARPTVGEPGELPATLAATGGRGDGDAEVARRGADARAASTPAAAPTTITPVLSRPVTQQRTAQPATTTQPTTTAPTARVQVDPNTTKNTQKDNTRTKKKPDLKITPPSVLKSPLLRLNDPLQLSRNIDTWSR